MEQLLAGAFVVIAVVFVANLADRVNRLEERSDPGASDGLNIVNRMTTAILRPSGTDAANLRAEDMGAALDLIDQHIGPRLFHQIPAIRRVMRLSIGLSWPFLRERVGITEKDLSGLEEQFAGVGFYPAASTTIEQWSTHMVVTDYLGNRKVFYENDSPPNYDPAYLLWKHTVPPDAGERAGGTLEVVLHGDFIKCWAIGGRFGQQIPPERVARDENIFVSIPITGSGLEKYLSIPYNGESEVEIVSSPWIREYSCGDADQPLWWTLRENDIASFVREYR